MYGDILAPSLPDAKCRNVDGWVDCSLTFQDLHFDATCTMTLIIITNNFLSTIVYLCSLLKTTLLELLDL